MAFDIVDKNGEDVLFAVLVGLEQQLNQNIDPGISFLQCKFFQLGIQPNAEEINELLQQTSLNDETRVFICDDGDVFIQFALNGATDDIEIKQVFLDTYQDQITQCMNMADFFKSYDLTIDLSALKQECFRKQGKSTSVSQKLSQYFENDLLISTLRNTALLISMQRSFRTKPHILIVEDQAFGQKIMTSILRDYECYIAGSSGEALMQYIEKYPDIVFLDINLPDLKGHEFAKLINKIDEHAFVVMVSSNRYPEDIKKAKENNVKGFIAKPFQNDEILALVDQYTRAKNRKPSIHRLM